MTENEAVAIIKSIQRHLLPAGNWDYRTANLVYPKATGVLVSCFAVLNIDLKKI